MKKSIERTLAGVGIGVMLWMGAGVFTYEKSRQYAQDVTNYEATVEFIESSKENDTKALDRYKLFIPILERQAKFAEEQGDKLLAEEYRKDAADYRRQKKIIEERYGEWDIIMKDFKQYLNYSKEKKEKWENLTDILNPFW